MSAFASTEKRGGGGLFGLVLSNRRSLSIRSEAKYLDVRFGSKADIGLLPADVRFTPPKADIRQHGLDVRFVPQTDI